MLYSEILHKWLTAIKDSDSKQKVSIRKMNDIVKNHVFDQMGFLSEIETISGYFHIIKYMNKICNCRPKEKN